MNLTNIDSINAAIPKYGIYNDKPQIKTDTMQFIDLPISTDYADFSIDYANDEVSTTVDSIKNSFDNSNYMLNNTSIVDCTSKYGEILKNINSNSKFDDNTKVKLTKILDNSFDNFAEKKIKQLSGNISGFFNNAYNIKESYAHEHANMGMKGDKILNEEDVEKNIRNMFLGAKNFYQNNPNGTKEQLDIFLQNKFSKTESIEKLSYNDFKSLEKSLDIVNNHYEIPSDISIIGSTKRHSELMNNALENLKKDGASSKLINAFEKAIGQNNSCKNRIEAYFKIRFGQEKRLDDLMAEDSNNQLMLKELMKKRQKMLEEYNKEMEKLKNEMHKMNMLNYYMNQNKGKYNPIESLTKQHNQELENLNEQQIQIENRINDIRKTFKETAENLDKFIKDPAAAIDSYLENLQ